SDGKTARLVSAQGDSRAVQAQATSVPADEEPFSQVYRHAEPFFSNDWHNPGSSDQSDDRSLALGVIPLVNTGHVVGSLNMAWYAPPDRGTDWKETLAAIAREITVGLDRIQTVTALQENAANLQAFFNSVQGFFFVVSRDGRILAVGEQGARRLGRTPAELVGTDINDLHPEEERDLSRVILGDMINGTRTSSTQTLVAADGTQIPVDTLVTRGSWNGSLALFTTSQDVTGSRRAAEALAADRRRADALYEIIEAAGKARSTEDFLPRALAIALEATPYEGGGIYLVDGDRAVLSCAMGVSNELAELIRSVSLDEQPYRTVLREGRPVAFAEPGMLPLDLSQEHGVASLVSVPIAVGDTIVGALNLVSSHVQSGELRTELLMSISRTIGDAVVRLRADESARASREDFETLFEAIPRLVFILREDGTIARINKAAAERLGRTPDELSGVSVLDLCPPDRCAEAACVVADMISGKTSLCTLSLMGREGDLFHVETQAVRTAWGGRPAIVGVSHEVMSTGADEECAVQALLHDDLTRLYSASGFSAIASQQLKMAHRGHINAAMVIAELAGGVPEPHILTDFTNVLCDTFRDSDTIGRIGPARFAVLAIQTDNTCLDLLEQRLQESVAAFNAERPASRPELVVRVVAIPVDAARLVFLDDLLSQAGAELSGPD
ncbi:MAG TPA: PAS domain S-box protein, partial [Clostridia bacterium]|nr:PAS domain S-box protein [Clostridia bacterium]